VFSAALDRGLAGLGLQLDAAQRAAIEAHVRLLLAWNRVMNLTAIVEPEAVAIRHVADSLTAVELVRRRGIDRFVDLGSGAGFPAIPLAVAVPVRRARLVEAVGKKAAFLSAAAGAVAAVVPDVHLEVACERAEAMAREPDARAAWPAVTARAVGLLGELVELAFPLLAPGGCLIAWKRGQLAGELAAAHRAMAALGGGSLEVVSVAGPGLAGHRLVVATRTGRVSQRFPRPPAQRRRQPW
jgi:16S rRNA (guanine527-N7)-methyltransferase